MGHKNMGHKRLFRLDARIPASIQFRFVIGVRKARAGKIKDATNENLSRALGARQGGPCPVIQSVRVTAGELIEIEQRRVLR
jgi:hypothetical protein